MLLTAGRLSVCCSRSNTAVELSKQGPASQLIAQRRAKQEESSPLLASGLTWLHRGEWCPGFLPPSLPP